MKRFILPIALFCMLPLANAEIYQNIEPLDRLVDIKKKFPNAQFEKLNAAWLQPSDVLYGITGPGIAGMIVIKLYDERPLFKEWFKDSEELQKVITEKYSDDRVQIRWVRWLIPNEIPLERVVAKYGKPDKAGFSDDSFTPFREWTKKGVYALLTNDSKSVFQLEFAFTDAEFKTAYTKKGEPIPDWLKEKTATSSKK